jgi:phage tail-like protein
MRFVVRVHGFEGVDSLGSWSSCKGLRVNFRTQSVGNGGDAAWLPTDVDYDQVILERAVEKDPSRQLQAWLSKLDRAWRNTKMKTGTVDIELYDARAAMVASWSLRDAYPVAWSGPAMDARTNAVALETLTFKYKGFLLEGDGGTPHAATTLAGKASTPSKTTEEQKRASLGPAESSQGGVTFAYNPTAIVISHATPVAPSAGLGQTDGAAGPELPAVEELEKGRATTSIILRGLTLADSDVAGDCQRLLQWSRFEAVSQDARSTKRAQLPRLTFGWGPHQYLVHLTQVTVTYTRFDEDGNPLRASVDLTLHSVPKVLRATNPSSGGLPGRRTHLLTGAESLPELATRTYGGPGRWREIAAANGFDDPLRVRPGTQVYLPGAREEER